MQVESWLECIECSRQYELKPLFFGCPDCAASGKPRPLEVHYRPSSRPLPPLSRRAGIWRWSDWLPPVAALNRVTLGEGDTPLIPIACPHSGVNLLLKNETVNPTWSWKDRPNCISISMAKTFGLRSVFATSTGNHGNAAAAYSTRAGLNCTVFCHPDAPALQLALMQAYGATVVRGGIAKGQGRQLLSQGDYYPASILCPRSGYSNPYGTEGFKTLAFEIVEELGQAPDRVFVPVGSGDGIYGIWKGFRELRNEGIIQRAPRMIACQARGADSAYRAFQSHSRHVIPLETAQTVALSIAELVVGDHAMRALYESNGYAVAMSDEAILKSAAAAARQGMAIEPASACTLAAAVATEPPEAQETWVIVASGSAVKWPNTLLANLSLPN